MYSQKIADNVFLREAKMEVVIQFKTPSCQKRPSQRLSLSGQESHIVGLRWKKIQFFLDLKYWLGYDIKDGEYIIMPYKNFIM